MKEKTAGNWLTEFCWKQNSKCGSCLAAQFLSSTLGAISPKSKTCGNYWKGWDCRPGGSWCSCSGAINKQKWDQFSL